MAKNTSTPGPGSNYQKYFDPKSLKSVASCAGMIFIIIHLIDYLSNFALPLRVLNFMTLSLCLIITFLFVVNEFGRTDEKIVLGLANAALLFFSVIGFNSTITSNGFSSARNTSPADTARKIGNSQSSIQPTNAQYVNASLLPLFKSRNWMPPADLENQIDTLTTNNRQLRSDVRSKSDSLILLRQLSVTGAPSGINQAYLLRYKACSIRLDSLQLQNEHLLSELKRYQQAANPAAKSQSSPVKANIDTATTMTKENYIQAYRTMKDKFENDLRRCQKEADEYRSKYNILIKQSQTLMDRVRPDGN